MQSDYAGKTSHKIILPLRAERGEGRGKESSKTQDFVCDFSVSFNEADRIDSNVLRVIERDSKSAKSGSLGHRARLHEHELRLRPGG